MSVVHERLQRRSSPKGTWYMKATDGKVYGPVDLVILVEWASQNRIAPGYQVSNNQRDWVPAESVTDLKMIWTAEMVDGRVYGPFNVLAVPHMFASGLLPADATLTNTDTGKTLKVTQLLKPSDRTAAPVPSGATLTPEEVEVVEVAPPEGLLELAQRQQTLDASLKAGSRHPKEAEDSPRAEQIRAGIEKLQAETAQIRKENQVLEKDLNQERTQREKLEQRLADREAKFQKQIQQLNRDLEAATGNLKAARGDLDKQQKGFEQQKNDLGVQDERATRDLEAAVQKAESRASSAESERKRLETELETQTQLHTVLSKSEGEKEAAMLREAAEAKTAMVNAEHELKALQERHQELEENVQQQRQQSAAHAEEVARQRELHLQLEQESSDLKQQAEQLKADVQNASVRGDSTRQDLARYQEEHQRLQDDAEAQQEKMGLEIEKLSGDIGSVTAERDRIRKELAEHEKQARIRDKQTGKREKELGRSLDKISKKAESEAHVLAKVKAELDEARRKTKELQGMRSKSETQLQKQIEQLHEEMSSEKTLYADVAAAGTRTETELRQQIDALRADLDAARTRSEELNGQLNALGESKDEQLHATVEELKTLADSATEKREAALKEQEERAAGLETASTEERERLEARIAELAAESGDRARGWEDTQSELSQSEARIAELEEALSSGKAALQLKIDELIQASDRTAAQHGAELEELQSAKAEQLRSTVEELKASVLPAAQKRDAEITRQKEEITSLKVLAAEERERLEARIAELAAESGDRARGWEDTQSELSQSEARIAELEEALSSGKAALQQRIDELIQASDRTEAQHGAELEKLRVTKEDQLRSTVEELKADAGSAEEQREAAIHEQQEKIVALEAASVDERERLEARMAELEAESAGRAQGWDRTQSNLSQAEARVAELEEALSAGEGKWRDKERFMAEAADEAAKTHAAEVDSLIGARDEELRLKLAELRESAESETEKHDVELKAQQDKTADLEIAAAEKSQAQESRIAELEAESAGRAEGWDATKTELSQAETQIAELEQTLSANQVEWQEQEQSMVESADQTNARHTEELETLRSTQKNELQSTIEELKASAEADVGQRDAELEAQREQRAEEQAVQSSRQSQLEERIAELEQESTARAEGWDATQAELEAALARGVALDETLIAKDEELQTSTSDLRGSLESTTQEWDQTQQQLTEAEAEIAKLEEVVARKDAQIRKQVTAFKSTVTSSEERHTGEMTTHQAEYRKLAEESAAKRKELDQRISGLQAVAASDAEVIETMRRDLDRTSTELTSAHERVAELGEESESRARQLSQQAEAADQTEEQSTAQHTETLVARDRDLASLREDHAAVRQDLEEKIAELEAAGQGLSADLESTRQDLAGVTEKANTLENTVAAKEDELQGRIVEVQVSAESVSEAHTAELETEHHRSVELEKELAGVQEQLGSHIQQLEGDLASAQQQVADKHTELEAAQAARAEVADAMSAEQEGAYLEQIQKIESRLAEEGKRATELEEELARQVAAHQALETDASSGADELALAKAEIEDLRAQYEPLLKKTQKHEKALTKQLAKVEAERARAASAAEEQKVHARVASAGSRIVDSGRSVSVARWSRIIGYTAVVICMGLIYWIGHHAGVKLQENKTVEDILRAYESDEEIPPLKEVDEPLPEPVVLEAPVVVETPPVVVPPEIPVVVETPPVVVPPEIPVVVEAPPVVTPPGLDTKGWPLVDVEGTRVTYTERACVIVFELGLFSRGTTFNVDAGAGQTLEAVAASIRGRLNGSRLIIEGHTDPELPGPGSSYLNNYALAMDRAKRVQQVLNVRHRISAEAMAVTSAGETDPPYPNVNAASRLKNRTVILRIVPRKRRQGSNGR